MLKIMQKSPIHWFKAIHENPMARTGKIEWPDLLEDAFPGVKVALLESITLALPDYGKPFNLTTACKDIMAAVLTQKQGKKQKPLGFYSKRLDSVA